MTLSADGRSATISEIETIILRIPFRADAIPGAALWGDTLSAAESLLVKVTTSDGIIGWGEAFAYSAISLVQRAVDELIAPMCIGQDAAKIGPLMHTAQRKYHVFGRGGPITYARSALDIALWDIAGKRAGCSVSELLGGGVEAFPGYASLACYSDPARVRAAVRQAVDAGFHAVKLHESSIAAIRAARDEAGPDVELIIDAGCPWSLAQALALAGELRDIGVKFLEEPLWPPENFAGLAALRRATGIAVATGENVSTLMEFERLLQAGAVDFVQPSPAKMGGISELRKVFPLASVHNVPVMTHAFYDGPGLLAALQVTAALGGPDSMIEWRSFDQEVPFYGEAVVPEKGEIKLPSGPGLGVDPDPELIRSYQQ